MIEACALGGPQGSVGGRMEIVSPDGWRIMVGQVGAGRLDTVGKTAENSRYLPELGGQGAAFREVLGVKIFVLTVVNALGVVMDKSGKVIRGLKDKETGRRVHPRELLDLAVREAPVFPADGNTTVTAIVINRKMERPILTQLARQVHASMARAIQPFHTCLDGDVLFALSTDAVDANAIDDFTLAEFASDVAWDAVLSAFDDS